MDDIDFAQALARRSRAGASRARYGETRTLVGRAVSDSSGGRVDVVLPGESVTEDGRIEVHAATTADVRRGDEVQVTLANGSPVVSGVVGGGDRTRDDIDAVARAAAEAQRVTDDAGQAARDAQAAADEAAKTAKGLTESTGRAIDEVTRIANAAASAASASNLIPGFCAPPGRWASIGGQFSRSGAWDSVGAASGWAWVSADNSKGTSTAYAWFADLPQAVTPGARFTLLAEFQAVQSTGSPRVFFGSLNATRPSCLATSASVSPPAGASETRFAMSAASASQMAAAVTCTRGIVELPAGSTFRGRVRFSLYEGDYDGPWLSPGSQSTANAASEEARAVASHVWENSAGLHVSTDERPAKGDDTGRNVLLSALGILLRNAGTVLGSFTGSGITLHDGKGVPRLSITASGVQMLDADGKTELAHFAANTQLGKAGGKHIVLDASKGIVLMDGKVALGSFTPSALTVGNASGLHLATTRQGVGIYQGKSLLALFGPSTVQLGQNSPASIIRMCGGKGSIEYRKDYFAKGSDALVIEAAALVNLLSSTSSVRMLASPGNLKTHGCVQAAKQHVSAGVGNGKSDQFGSGGYFDLTARQMTMRSDNIAFSTGGHIAALRDWVKSQSSNSSGTASRTWASGRYEYWCFIQSKGNAAGNQVQFTLKLPQPMENVMAQLTYNGGESYQAVRSPFAYQADATTVHIYMYPPPNSQSMTMRASVYLTGTIAKQAARAERAALPTRMAGGSAPDVPAVFGDGPGVCVVTCDGEVVGEEDDERG